MGDDDGRSSFRCAIQSVLHHTLTLRVESTLDVRSVHASTPVTQAEVNVRSLRRVARFVDLARVHVRWLHMQVKASNAFRCDGAFDLPMRCF